VVVWYWIDFTLLAAVPFVVILTGNCVMITCVVQAVRFRGRHEPHPVNSAGHLSSSGTVVGDKGKAITSSTVMLMTLSVVFLVTTSPNVVYFLKSNDWIAESNDAHSEARLDLAFAVINLLYYTNNASNFFLYCLAGSRFRRAMCQMFSCRSRLESRCGGAAGAVQASRSAVKLRNQRHRTIDAPLDGMISTVHAAEAAGCITLSTNVTIHPSA